MTDNQEVADALKASFIDQQRGGIQELTEAQFIELKKNSEQIQSERDSRSQVEKVFREPGMVPQQQRNPLSNPLIAPVPAAAPVVVGNSGPSTVIQTPVQMSMHQPPKAEPIPGAEVFGS